MLHISITFALTYLVSFNLVNPVALSLKNDLIVQGKFICLQKGTKKKTYLFSSYLIKSYLKFPLSVVFIRILQMYWLSHIFFEDVKFFVRSSHSTKVLYLLSFKQLIGRAAMLRRSLVCVTCWLVLYSYPCYFKEHSGQWQNLWRIVAVWDSHQRSKVSRKFPVLHELTP